MADTMEQCPPPTIIIVIDSLRIDYSRPIDSVLRKRGFRGVDNAVSTAPWTIPSHASMMTGLYPLLHGAHETPGRKTPFIGYPEYNKLCSIFGGQGLLRLLATANPLVHPRYGLYCFDSLAEPGAPPLLMPRPSDFRILSEANRAAGSGAGRGRLFLEVARRSLGAAVRLAVYSSYTRLHWKLQRASGRWPRDKGANSLFTRIKKFARSHKRFLAMANVVEVHEPYSKDDNLYLAARSMLLGDAPRDLVGLWRRGYAGQVERVAEVLADLIDDLDDSRALENTLFIVTSDHGQLLGEGGRLGHGIYLDDELLRVPLWIRYPASRDEGLPYAARGRWLSLRMLPKLVCAGLGEAMEDTVYAESYGVHIDPGELPWEEARRAARGLDGHKIAVYHRNVKAVFDVEQGSFVEARNYWGDKPDEEVLNMLRKRIQSFLLIGRRLRRVRLR